MTKKELAVKIAQSRNIPVEHAEAVLDELGNVLAESEVGERTFIPRLGFFTLVKDKRTKSGVRLEFKPSAVFKLTLKKIAAA